MLPADAVSVLNVPDEAHTGREHSQARDIKIVPPGNATTGPIVNNAWNLSAGP